MATNPRRSVLRRSLSVLAAGALLACPGLAAPTGEGVAPTPAVESLEEIPSATRDDVVRLLRKLRRKYGEHAVVIDTNLLINSMRHGSLLATSARIDGVKPYRGKSYLGFQVETGLVFESATRDLAARIHFLWSAIVLPTLERLTELSVPADGIRIALSHHHRSYESRDQLRASIDRPGTSEEAAFYLLAPDVAEFAAQRLTARDLGARARIAVDGKERDISIPDGDPPTAPGPE